MSACGLDFGTSNTTLGSTVDHAPELVALEGGQTTIPSAIFYGRDGAVCVGRKAIDAYVEGIPGRLMRSLKSVLGTALVDETTQVGVERSSFRDVIASYLRAVKRRAEQACGREYHPHRYRWPCARRIQRHRAQRRWRLGLWFVRPPTPPIPARDQRCFPTSYSRYQNQVRKLTSPLLGEERRLHTSTTAIQPVVCAWSSVG